MDLPVETPTATHVPAGLIQIQDVPNDYIEGLWSGASARNRDDFESPPSEANIRLFNYVVRAALHDNLPPPDMSDVLDMITGAITFMMSEDEPESVAETDDLDLGMYDYVLDEITGAITLMMVETEIDEPESESETDDSEPDETTPEGFECRVCVVELNLDGEIVLANVFDLTHFMLEEVLCSRSGEILLVSRDEFADLEAGYRDRFDDSPLPARTIREEPRIDENDAYSILTQERHQWVDEFGDTYLDGYEHDDVLFGRDPHHGPRGYCNCNQYYGQSGEADLHRPYFPSFVVRSLDYRRNRALQQAGITGMFSGVGTRALIQQRQARFSAGLDVSSYDREITRRVLSRPDDFGPLGEAIYRYIMEIYRDGDNYELH